MIISHEIMSTHFAHRYHPCQVPISLNCKGPSPNQNLRVTCKYASWLWKVETCSRSGFSGSSLSQSLNAAVSTALPKDVSLRLATWLLSQAHELCSYDFVQQSICEGTAINDMRVAGSASLSKQLSLTSGKHQILLVLVPGAPLLGSILFGPCLKIRSLIRSFTLTYS